MHGDVSRYNLQLLLVVWYLLLASVVKASHNAQVMASS